MILKKVPFYAVTGLGLALAAIHGATLYAASPFIAEEPGYHVQDAYSGRSLAGFSLGSGGTSLLGWDNAGSLVLLDSAGGLTTDFGAPEEYSGYNSFVKFNGNFTRALVGFTTDNNADDRIYEVDLDLGSWSYLADFQGNYDAEYVGNDIFISGANNAVFGPNAIWKLDTSPAGNHDKILDTGGFSAGLAFDAAGNLYFGTAGTGADKLVFLTAAQIDLALGPDSLALTEAEVITALGGFGADVEVAPDGTVIFSLNGAAGEIWAYDPGLDTLTQLATGVGFTYLTLLDAAETGVFQSAFGENRLAHITAVPEPSTAWLVALCAIALIHRRRR